MRGGKGKADLLRRAPLILNVLACSARIPVGGVGGGSESDFNSGEIQKQISMCPGVQGSQGLVRCAANHVV